MITAIDTSVLLDVFLADPEFGGAPAAALRACRSEGQVIACDGRRSPQPSPQFLIGVHAATYADRLLTRDRGFYRSYFANVTVLDLAS